MSTAGHNFHHNNFPNSYYTELTSSKHRIVSVLEHKKCFIQIFTFKPQLRRKFQVPCIYGSLLIATKPKARFAHSKLMSSWKVTFSNHNYSMKYNGPHFTLGYYHPHLRRLHGRHVCFIQNKAAVLSHLFDVSAHTKSNINPSCVSKVTSVSNTTTKPSIKSANECQEEMFY